MTELHQANEHPLNQRAKALLKQAKADAEPNALYVAQLLWWSLEQSKIAVGPKLRDRIVSAAESLLGAEPAHGMKWLLTGEEKDSEFLRPNALDRLSPVEASYELLETLHRKLQVRQTGY